MVNQNDVLSCPCDFFDRCVVQVYRGRGGFHFCGGVKKVLDFSSSLDVTQALVSFAPLAFKLFYAARQNAVLRRSPFPSP